MKAIFAACLLLLSVCAIAAPEPLFTIGAPIAADHPVQKMIPYIPNFKAAHPIVLGRGAFGAEEVSVEINGKVHVFVMHPVTMGSNPLSVWAGEEDDDSFSMRPDILLRHFDSGEFSGDVFLPPRSYFSFRSDHSPTVLVEMENDVGVRRGPAWLILLRLVGYLIIFGCVFGFGAATTWHWIKSRRGAANKAAVPY